MFYFVSLSSFLHMGGYAIYIWSAFALAIVILLANVTFAHAKLRRIMKGLRNYHADKT